MFINPNLSSQLAREHQRDLLAEAERHHLVGQLRTASGASLPAATTKFRARDLVMVVGARLRRAARVLIPAPSSRLTS
jgi:hypothetical protein